MNLFTNSKHKGSDLLTGDDNNKIFDLVGRNCKILSTTVIELHRSPDATGEGDWTKEEIGVLCLVQVSNRDSHFFRMFCLFRKRLVWEHEICKEIQYSTPKPFLHSFQSRNCMYAFYFVSEQEADHFAAHMREISIDLLENEQRSENSKLHEINPVVEPPPEVNSGSDFNKTTNISSSRLSTPGRFFSKCFRKTEATKKKSYTGDDIGTPGRFKHVSHICEFKQIWRQIQRGNKEDKTSIPMQKLSNISELIIPVVKTTPNYTNSPDTSIPPLPSKKSHLRNRFSTFIHPGEETIPDDVDNLPPPLPEKKSPRLPHRQFVSQSSTLNESHYDCIGSSISLFSGKRVIPDFGASNSDGISNYPDSTTASLPVKKSPQLNQGRFSPNPNGLSEADNFLLNSAHLNSKLNQGRFSPNPKSSTEAQNFLFDPAQLDSKSFSLDDRWSNLNPFRSSSQFISDERAYDSLSNSRSNLNSQFDDPSSSDSLSNYPNPPPLIVAERRKIEAEVGHQNDDEDPSQCLYDTIPCRPRPVHSSRSNSVPHSEPEMGCSRYVNKRELSLFPSSSSANIMAQRNSDDVQKKAYEVAPVTTQHPFLLPPSSGSCSTPTLKPSCSVALVNDPVRNALNAAIKKGVELKRTDGVRRKSFSRERDG